MTARPPAPGRYTTTLTAYAIVSAVLLAVVCAAAGIASGPHAALATAALLLGIPIAGTAALAALCLLTDHLTRRRWPRLRLRYWTAPDRALVLTDTPRPGCPHCLGEGWWIEYVQDGPDPEDGERLDMPCDCWTPWRRTLLRIPRPSPPRPNTAPTAAAPAKTADTATNPPSDDHTRPASGPAPEIRRSPVHLLPAPVTRARLPCAGPRPRLPPRPARPHTPDHRTTRTQPRPRPRSRPPRTGLNMHAIPATPLVPADPYPALSAPAGRGAARTIAHRHAAAGRHTHLITDGETECVSGHCPAHTITRER